MKFTATRTDTFQLGIGYFNHDGLIKQWLLYLVFFSVGVEWGPLVGK